MVLSRLWVAYLAAAASGEILLHDAPAITAAIDGLVLVAALTQFGLAERSPLAIGDASVRLLPAVALVPLMRLLSLTMPVPTLPSVTWIVLAGAPLLIAVPVTARLVVLSVRDIGLATRPRDLVSVGIILASIPAGIVVGQLTVSDLSGSWDSPMTSGVAALAVVSCGALPEELVFRGILQPLAVRRTGRLGIVLVAMLHAATYLGTGSAAAVAIMGIVGFVYGWDMARTGSLWPPLVGHSLLAVAATIVAPMLAQLPMSP